MASPHIPVCAMPHVDGWHLASWRRDGARGNDIWNPDLLRDIAQTAERGMLDAVFFADNQTLWPVPEHLRHHTAKVGVWDALIASAVVATVTDRIGIVATAHTEFRDPYSLARQLACLDHLSHGRMGWNVVTSGDPTEYANFGKERPESKDLLYARATDFVEAMKKLWDSWEDDAYIVDQQAGVFFDPAKLHTPAHDGPYFSSQGPLNVMRPPQGYPVFAQAGGSAPGKVLAGTVGELIFSPLSGEAAARYRQDVRRIAADAGRDPDTLKVLAQLTPVIAATDEEAEEKWSSLQRMLHPEIQRGVLESMLREDISGYDLDQPLPDKGQVGYIEGYRQSVTTFRMPDGRVPTLRELLEHFKGPGTVVGSPKTIADYMQQEVESGACDGFCLLMQGVPEELDDFVEMVVPELQARGLFRTSYPEGTFREQLGLPHPVNQFAAAEQAS